MKKDINIGNRVDDGTGTWLREGGKIINENFSEIYEELGDGANVHPAGAWAIVAGKNALTCKFGKSYAINTIGGKVDVQLPKGSAKNYSEVIRLRDVWSSWANNEIVIHAAQGDTIKGSSKPVGLKKNLMDIELVYCSPGRWQYVDNKQVDRISTSDLSTVARAEFIIEKDGQTDFLNIFGSDNYNVNNTTVHWRGNLLTYGKEFSKDISDFGSPGKTKDEIVPLDGLNIRLKYPTQVGDTVTITSYLDGIASWRSTYERGDLRLIDPELSSEMGVKGQTTVIHNKRELEVSLFDSEKPNPHSMEVILNGLVLTRVGDVGVLSNQFPEDEIISEDGDIELNDRYTGYCFNGIGHDQESCELAGGTWQIGIGDYYLEYNDSGEVVKIKFNMDLSHNDILTIRWFNNNVGTTMSLADILIKTDERYINSGEAINLTNRIKYDSYDNNPTQKNAIPDVDLTLTSISNVMEIFDMVVPVGRIIEIAHNPANPATFMGFGRWVRFAEGQTTVGWDSSPTSSLFHKNNNDLDQNGNPRSSAGGTVGNITTKIDKINIPPLKAEGMKVLVSDPDGDIAIGGCFSDPDESNGPGYKKFRESEIFFGSQTEGYEPKSIDIVQPSITVYKWLRVE